MSPHRAAVDLDPAVIIRAASANAINARSNDETEAVSSLVDVEERVVFEQVERVVPDGDRLVAEARSRHQAILDAMATSGMTPSTVALVDAHVRESADRLYPPLFAQLDDAGRSDLAAALEAARAPQADVEPTGTGTADPTDAAGATARAVAHPTGERQALQNRAEDPPA